MSTSTVMPISNFYNHVNFILLQSCQFQNPAVMSSQFQSICPMQFAICSAKWLVRIQEQLVLVNLFLLSAKRRVRIQEQLVLINLLLLSAKRPVQIQEQLVPVYLSVFSVELPVRSKRTTCTCQSCYLLSCGCLPIPQWIRHTLFAILSMSTNPAMDTTYFVKLNSQFVLHS